ncbi:MAG: hypothetical protein QOF11_1362 [Chloroflexota bacterium]|nr:hypothetical protein [Chloroflexota bacterium]
MSLAIEAHDLTKSDGEVHALTGRGNLVLVGRL